MEGQEHLHRGETASARMLPSVINGPSEPRQGMDQDVAEGQGPHVGGPLSPGSTKGIGKKRLKHSLNFLSSLPRWRHMRMTESLTRKE